MSLSTSAGTSYQNASTFLFVPKAYGKTQIDTDDTNTPGAYFRLGGSSDIESGASSSDTNVAAFYPRQHVTDEGSSADAVSHAAGSSTGSHGIMLACSGRLLLRSDEKTYLHSKGAIDIDTESTMRINAVGAIDIVSGEQINIQAGTNEKVLITAGTTVATTAAKATRRINGHDFDEVMENTYKYTQANIYTYKLGGLVDVTLGGAFAFWLGNKLTINISIDVTITPATAFTFYLLKFELGLYKADFVKFKTEFKDGSFVHTTWGVDLSAGAVAKAANAKAEKTTLEATIKDLKANVGTLTSDMTSVNSKLTNIESTVGNLVSVT